MVKKSNKRYVKTQRIHANPTGTGAPVDNSAEITIARDCELTSIIIDAHADFDADGDYFIAEFSAVPNYQAASNGSVGQIAVVRSIFNIATTGAAVSAVNLAISFPTPMVFFAGEKVYLNTEIKVGKVAYLGAVLHLAEFDAPVRR